MDAVITSTFPDIRKRCAIHSSEGSIMIIPRERIPGGKVLTRVYCQMSSLESASKAESRAARNAITLERLTTQTAKALAPYSFSFSDVDWWAAYQIGQRTASAFSLADSNGVKRVHIAGDACHTHSPKAGQGMNVSMMDTYNLSFKLAHVLNGLAPPEILDTYESERLDIARQLIEFDTKFSSMFSGRIGEDSGLTHDEFVSVFRTGGGFTSGCGIEYGPGMLVDPQVDIIKDGNRSLGLLWPGRRLMNVRTIRFADANPRNLQDDFASTGVYRILLMLPRSWREKTNMQQVIQKYTSGIPDQFPRGAMETAIMYPGERGDIEWTDFPEAVRERNEWLLLGDAFGEAYTTFGVNEEVGAVAVVRPDGYVGMVGRVEETARVRAWLAGVLNAIPDGPQ
jgi:phenol 2-monooxygenase